MYVSNSYLHHMMLEVPALIRKCVFILFVKPVSAYFNGYDQASKLHLYSSCHFVFDKFLSMCSRMDIFKRCGK